MEFCKQYSDFFSWYSSQSANNTFTLFGALSAFAVAIFALRLTRAINASATKQEDTRARVAAYFIGEILYENKGKLAAASIAISSDFRIEPASMDEVLAAVEDFESSITFIEADILFSLSVANPRCALEVMTSNHMLLRVKEFGKLCREEISANGFSETKSRIDAFLYNVDLAKKQIEKASDCGFTDQVQQGDYMPHRDQSNP